MGRWRPWHGLQAIVCCFHCEFPFWIGDDLVCFSDAGVGQNLACDGFMNEAM